MSVLGHGMPTSFSIKIDPSGISIAVKSEIVI